MSQFSLQFHSRIDNISPIQATLLVWWGVISSFRGELRWGFWMRVSGTPTLGLILMEKKLGLFLEMHLMMRWWSLECPTGAPKRPGHHAIWDAQTLVIAHNVRSSSKLWAVLFFLKGWAPSQILLSPLTHTHSSCSMPDRILVTSNLGRGLIINRRAMRHEPERRASPKGLTNLTWLWICDELKGQGSQGRLLDRDLGCQTWDLGGPD